LSSWDFSNSRTFLGNLISRFTDCWSRHLGENKYMAQIDVFHQLHCLNSLRKLVYPEYYNWTTENAHHPELWYIHNNHCIDILMQNIMCNANTDLYTMNWMVRIGRRKPSLGAAVLLCRAFIFGLGRSSRQGELTRFAGDTIPPFPRLQHQPSVQRLRFVGPVEEGEQRRRRHVDRDEEAGGRDSSSCA